MDKKSILKILTIFILGMAIGAFFMGGFVKHRMNRIHHHHAGKGFSESLIHITKVEGNEKEQLMDLGEKYGSLLKAMEKEHFNKRADLLKALEEEGNVFLTGRSKEEFQRHLHKMRTGPRERRERENH